jgi:hypothetical protein
MVWPKFEPGTGGLKDRSLTACYVCVCGAEFVFELHWKVTVSGEYVRIVKIVVPVPVFAWRDCGKVREP